MEIIRNWDLPIKSECGYVSDEWFARLPQKSDEQVDQLAILSDRKPNTRLACPVLRSERPHGRKATLAPDAVFT